MKAQYVQFEIKGTEGQAVLQLENPEDEAQAVLITEFNTAVEKYAQTLACRMSNEVRRAHVE